MVGPSFSLWSEAIMRFDFTIKVVVLIVGKHAFQNTNMLACIPCWDINHSKTYHSVDQLPLHCYVHHAKNNTLTL